MAKVGGPRVKGESRPPERPLCPRCYVVDRQGVELRIERPALRVIGNPYLVERAYRCPACRQTFRTLERPLFLGVLRACGLAWDQALHAAELVAGNPLSFQEAADLLLHVEDGQDELEAAGAEAVTGGEETEAGDS